MATIKSFTDIEQSKKLAEFLPIGSADMYYINGDVGKISIGEWENNVHDEDDIPCWSLAALLGVLPDYNLQRTDWENNKTEYKIVVTINDYNYASKNYDNPLDACYGLILKLNELNLL